MTIDVHVHPWTRNFVIRNSPLVDTCKYFNVKLNQIPESVEDFVQEMDAAGVDRSVLHGQDANYTKNPQYKNFTISNKWMAKLVKGFEDRFVLFAGIDPNAGTIAAKELRYALLELKFSGLKIHSCVNEIYPTDKRIGLLCEICQEFDVPIVFHTGTTGLSHCDIKYGKPEYIDEVATLFPDLKMVLTHFGWPWQDVAIAVALRHKNVFLDISGWKPVQLPKTLLTYIKGPLKERVLFGTDYPLIRQTEWMDDLKSISHKLGQHVVKRLLDTNARMLLKL